MMKCLDQVRLGRMFRPLTSNMTLHIHQKRSRKGENNALDPFPLAEAVASQATHHQASQHLSTTSYMKDI